MLHPRIEYVLDSIVNGNRTVVASFRCKTGATTHMNDVEREIHVHGFERQEFCLPHAGVPSHDHQFRQITAIKRVQGAVDHGFHFVLAKPCQTVLYLLATP